MTHGARWAAGGRRTLILAYHRVVHDVDAERGAAIPGLLISAATFERHLVQLRRAGFSLVTLGEALEVSAGLRTGRGDLAVLTFDDGYRDNYEVAFPILQKHRAPATIFLPTDFIGTERRLPHDRLFQLLSLARARAGRAPSDRAHLAGADPWSPMLERRPEEAVAAIIEGWSHAQILRMIDVLAARLHAPAPPRGGTLLDWTQCQTMRRSGLVSFGAHTQGHVALHREPLASVEREIRQSRRAVERELDAPCRDFAYPNGQHSPEIVRALVRAGFRSAVTTEDAPNRRAGDPYRLGRKTLWENHSRGLGGAHSDALLACQLDGVFGMLGMQRPVPGTPPDSLERARRGPRPASANARAGGRETLG